MFRSWNATCPRGAEPALEGELRGIGAKGIRPGTGIVRFTGEREVALRACLELRTALRVLEPVGEFPATNADQLYDGARKQPWTELISKGQTIAVSASGACGRSGAAAAMSSPMMGAKRRVCARATRSKSFRR